MKKQSGILFGYTIWNESRGKYFKTWKIDNNLPHPNELRFLTVCLILGPSRFLFFFGQCRFISGNCVRFQTDGSTNFWRLVSIWDACS